MKREQRTRYKKDDAHKEIRQRIPMPSTFAGRRIIYQSRGTLYTAEGAPVEGVGFIGIE